MDLRDLGGREEVAQYAPMKYPGSKYDSLAELLPLLPYRKVFVDVFGGSGTVILNRRSSKLDVFNDINSDIINFYRVLRSDTQRLIGELELYLHSREEFEFCRDTYAHETDPLQRAVKWYYTIQSSFLGKGKSFARVTSSAGAIAGSLYRKLPTFWPIHMRFISVQIENLDYSSCMYDYDSPDTVFYLDPPYYGSDVSSYEDRQIDHNKLLKQIMNTKGFVAISGYDNELYNSFKWTDMKSWIRKDRANAQAISIKNNRTEKGQRNFKVEKLWIKE